MKCPRCKKNRGQTRTGNLLRCNNPNCRALMDPRDDGEVYADPTKRMRLHESGHHEKVARQQALKGGLAH